MLARSTSGRITSEDQLEAQVKKLTDPLIRRLEKYGSDCGGYRYRGNGGAVGIGSIERPERQEK